MIEMVTTNLPSVLGWFGTVLTALFTAEGKLAILGGVVVIGFVGAIIYKGVGLIRSLTPGV